MAGNLVDAEQAFRACLARGAGNYWWKAVIHLAELRIASGDYSDAQQMLMQLLASEGHDADKRDASVNLGICLAPTDPLAAEVAFQWAMEGYDKATVVRAAAHLCELLGRMGRGAEAPGLVDRIVTWVGPAKHNAELSYGFGVLYFAAENQPLAIQSFRDAERSRDPGVAVGAKVGLACAQYRAGDYSAAVVSSQAAIAEGNGWQRTRAHLYLGAALFRCGDLHGGKEALTVASLSSDRQVASAARAQLAAELIRTNRADEARGLIETLLRGPAGEAAAIGVAQAGYLEMMAGKPDSAQMLWSRASQSGYVDAVAASNIYRALHLFFSGQTEGAATLLRATLSSPNEYSDDARALLSSLGLS